MKRRHTCKAQSSWNYISVCVCMCVCSWIRRGHRDAALCEKELWLLCTRIPQWSTWFAFTLCLVFRRATAAGLLPDSTGSCRLWTPVCRRPQKSEWVWFEL